MTSSDLKPRRREFQTKRGYETSYNNWWRKKYPEKAKIIQDRFYSKHPEVLIRNRDRKRVLRREAIHKLGDKCVYCGCDNQEALEINHINGGGKQFAKRSGISGCKALRMIRDGVYPVPVELACRVCNAVHYLGLKGILGFKVSWRKDQ